MLLTQGELQRVDVEQILSMLDAVPRWPETISYGLHILILQNKQHLTYSCELGDVLTFYI